MTVFSCYTLSHTTTTNPKNKKIDPRLATGGNTVSSPTDDVWLGTRLEIGNEWTHTPSGSTTRLQYFGSNLVGIVMAEQTKNKESLTFIGFPLVHEKT